MKAFTALTLKYGSTSLLYLVPSITNCTSSAATAEADFVLNMIKDYPISYPVVLDVESTEMSALTPAQLADVINAFCKKVEAAGYYPMVYTNDTGFPRRSI